MQKGNLKLIVRWAQTTQRINRNKNALLKNRQKIILEHAELGGPKYSSPEYIQAMNKPEVKYWMIKSQLGRRNLSKGQKVAIYCGPIMVIEKELALERMEKGRPKKDDPSELVREDTGKAAEKVGFMLGVSDRLVYDFENVQEKAPELVPVIAAGKLTIKKAIAAVKKENPEVRNISPLPLVVKRHDC
jgi:hypothetical protein